mgnify:CR=1
MPTCTRELFKRDGDEPFLEIHHILPLANKGEDTLENAAALCPSCHREVHHGVNRVARTAELKAAIAAKPAL